MYLDDVVIFSAMQEEHLDKLRAILESFREHGLKLKPSKCSFFHQEIEYLGHQVSKDGIWPSKSNLRAIAEFAPPRMYTEIRAFLGMAGHYRHFIKNYARIALPLTDYHKGDSSKKQEEDIVLNKEVLEAFNTLKHSVQSAPILVYLDPKGSIYSRKMLRILA